MRNLPKILLLAVFAFALSACSRSLPLISHAHVGHALTSWHDTPNQRGLYVIARDEATEALTIMRKLDRGNAGSEQKIAGLKQVAYILNSDVAQSVSQQFGRRYGVIRAMEGVLDHIEYAASSEDASLNLVSSVNDLSEKGEVLLNNINAVFEVASNNDPSNLDAKVNQLASDLDLIVNGKKQGDSIAFYGMANFTDDFNAMLERESNPRYEPLPRRYVLGLVRLPNGHWGYKLDSSQSSQDDRY